MKSLFDDVSRIIASPAPRRQALRMIGGTLGGAFLASLGLEKASVIWASTAGVAAQCPTARQVFCGNICCKPGQVCCSGSNGDFCCSGTCCGSTGQQFCCSSGQHCCQLSGGPACCSGACCEDKCCGVNEVCCGNPGF